MHGGGVLIAVKGTIASSHVFVAPDVELIAVKASLSSNKTIIIICCYIPPHSTTSYVTLVVNYISCLTTQYPNNDFIILGDLNHPEIEWDSLTSNTATGVLICDCLFRSNLFQLIRDPTHIKGGLLDVVITNNPQALSNINTNSAHPPQRSDHHLITFNYVFSALTPTETSNTKRNTKRLWLYSKANTPRLLDFVSSRITTLTITPLLQSTINTLWSFITNILKEAQLKFIPSVTTHHQQPKWFNSEIRHKLNCLHTTRRHFKMHPTPFRHQKLQQEETNLQLQMESAKLAYERKLVLNLSSRNSQQLYSYLHELSSTNANPTSVYPLNSSTPTTNDLQTAEAFNQYFHSVFSTSDYVLPSIDKLPTPPQQIHTLEVQPHDVCSVIDSLRINKSYGCDDISPDLIKLCAEPLLSVLTQLFSQCLVHSSIPNTWKIHKIIPIYKKGDRSQVTNYRPISLLCTTSIILEKIIYRKILDHIRTHISARQFGFLANRSCLLNLLESYSKVSSSLDRLSTTHAIYLDFSKAFDTIPHHELLFKLWRFGITGTLWLWFRTYLIDRQHFVQINNTKSNHLTVVSGVPQGSVLGPLLFLIYINDLPDVIQYSEVHLFADDTKLILDVLDFCPRMLQEDLQAMYDWCQEWKLQLNPDKCQMICFTNRHSDCNSSQYLINNQTVQESTSIRDLGIAIDKSFTFENHYKTICAKAYKTLHLIRRTMNLHQATVHTKRQLYLSLIRSKLTYCSQLWRPHLVKHCMMLENVQRRCTKIITNDYTSDYKTRLQQIDLLPLMYWYDLQDILYLIKCFQNPPDNINIFDHIAFTTSSTRSSSNNKLVIRYARTTSARHFFFHRVVRLWNAMPHINLNLPFNSIKKYLTRVMYRKFERSFDPNNSCTFHFVCPCSLCHQIPTYNFL